MAYNVQRTEHSKVDSGSRKKNHALSNTPANFELARISNISLQSAPKAPKQTSPETGIPLLDDMRDLGDFACFVYCIYVEYYRCSVYKRC